MAVPVSRADDRPVPGPGAAQAAAGLGVDLAVQLERAAAEGVAGEVVSLPVSTAGTETLHLVGVGDGSPAALRKAGAALARRTGQASRLRTSLAGGVDVAGVEALIAGLLLASYRFRLGADDSPPKLSDIELLVDDPASPEPVRRRALATMAATALARDLVNTPSLEKSPAWLAEQARRLAGSAGCTVRVSDERELAADGFGGVVGVGMGSAQPPG